MERIVSRQQQEPIKAEITGSTEGVYYLVETFPGKDLRALKHLGHRGFGVWQAQQQRGTSRAKSAGDLRPGWEPVFPGWLFVVVWDMDKMRNRILRCPGVRGILSMADGTPMPIADSFVMQLRQLSWIYDDSVEHARCGGAHARVRGRRHEKRLDKRSRKELKRIKVALKTVGKFDEELWKDASQLDASQRIGLLKRALAGPAVELSGSVK